MARAQGGTFRSLKNPNYRLWAAGALVSNLGTWMQRTAQDWLVLTILTDHNATALGIMTALQFVPQLLLLPLTGFAADRIDRRKLLMVTQACIGLLALGLGLLTVTGLVQLWHAYGFALLLGCATAFDSPVRQAFVSEMVGDDELPNAVAINSTSFNSARMIGPAIAGLSIAAIGTGWVFVINAVSFVPVLWSLVAIKPSRLYKVDRPLTKSGLWDAFPYVWQNKVILFTLIMQFLMGSVGLNFPIFISTMSTLVFHGKADQYGLLTSMLAIGTISGALMAAKREKPRLVLLLLGALGFCVSMLAAAIAPNIVTFCLALVVTGLAAQTFIVTANSSVQLATQPFMRGRVMAVFMAISLGGMPLGGPLVGWVVDLYGARWGMALGAMGGLSAALVGIFYWLTIHRPSRRKPSVSSNISAP
ncbi:MFS transporter [Gallaecimonas mangrovi]|uniref:MFS transporter n=1 Tax=Gallaecimonas mangrovi TaxID=2291597 RepID=UPI000E203656|nr:MFS transporter [Gallaecimonas mangrovi]